MSENTGVTKLSESCGGMANYEKVMYFDSEHPLPWDSMVVTSHDVNGDPLIAEYYLGTIFQFKVTKTFAASGKVESITIE
jgi:hypothetical protein